MEEFFWWSGVVAWFCLGMFGLSLAIDAIADIVITSIWTKREFLAFVADRLKAKREPT